MLQVAHDTEAARQQAEILRLRTGELEALVRGRTYDLEEYQLEAFQRLAVLAEFRDTDTGEHTIRVGDLSAFIATEEARASDAYKQASVEGSSDDIVYSNLFTGVHGNYLAASIRAAGLDPENLPESDPSKMNFGGDAKKAWKDIWGCGQGIGSITEVVPAAELVARLAREYQTARARLTLA